MEELILKNLLNYGIFPACTFYLVFVIIKDFRSDMKELKTQIEKNYLNIEEHYEEINKSLQELVIISEQMQSYMINYLNTLLIKLLDVIDDVNKNK